MEIIIGSIVFGFLYSFADAWHDEKVINNLKKWHSIDAFIKGLVAFVIGGVVYYYTRDYIMWIGVTVGIIAARKLSFNFFLNKLMGWDKDHRRKEGLDKYPDWIGLILIIGIIVYSIIKH